MLFHLIEPPANLFDEFVQRRQLNVGLRDFRLLRDNGFPSLSAFAQDFHAEGHRGRRHSIYALRCFLGHAQI